MQRKKVVGYKDVYSTMATDDLAMQAARKGVSKHVIDRLEYFGIARSAPEDMYLSVRWEVHAIGIHVDKH